MPNTQIVADPALLESASRNFVTQAQALADALNKVNSVLQELEPAWKGWAKDQFDSLMVTWTSDFNNIQTVLESVGKLVDQAQIGYTDLDQSIARSFSH